MGIDIRQSPYQIECIHCGECVDACEDVLGRFGREGLIHYAWGEQGELLTDERTPLLRRLGLRDGKRAVAMLVLLFYVSGLLAVLSTRDDVLVRIAPVRATLYRLGDDGRVYNRFRMTAANRQHKASDLTLSLVDLPDARIELPQSLHLSAETETQMEFEISAPAGALPPGVNHFQIVSRATPGAETTTTEMTFITPTEKKPR
jgi:polyferredoxin